MDVDQVTIQGEALGSRRAERVRGEVVASCSSDGVSAGHRADTESATNLVRVQSGEPAELPVKRSHDDAVHLAVVTLPGLAAHHRGEQGTEYDGSERDEAADGCGVGRDR